MKGIIFKVTTLLALRGFIIREGSASSSELDYLQKLVERENVRNIGEIGFNAGFSSYAFLEVHPEIKVTSFDLGAYPYIWAAKKIIDKKFPRRHKLIIGDSKKTLPKFYKENPNIKFDLIFIDGGHNYKTVKSDILNMRPLSRDKTAVVIDDLTPWLPWGKGPTQAWTEAIDKKIIVQEELFKDGKQVNEMKAPGERSWALGRYMFKDYKI